MIRPLNLWNPDSGLGAPQFVASDPPFHPLSLAVQNLLYGERIEAVAAGVLCGWLLLRLIPSTWRLRVAVALVVAVGLTVVPAGISLAALGILSAYAAAELYRRVPSRARWFLLALTGAIAILGFTYRALWLFVPLAAFQVVRASRVSVEHAGKVLAAAFTSCLVAAFWWYPAVVLGREAAPSVSHRPLRSLYSQGNFGRQLTSTDPDDAFTSRRLATMRSLAASSAGDWRFSSPFFDFLNIHDLPRTAPVRTVNGFIRTATGAWKNTEALPRYFLVRSFVVWHSVEESVKALGPVVDYGSVATVDHIPEKVRNLSGAHVTSRIGVQQACAGGSAVVTGIRGDIRTLFVRSLGWNLLVSSEPWWRGWRVYWNGERLPPVVVNGAFLGTFVPPGVGTLELRYRPNEFDIGVRAAALGLLLLVSALAVPWVEHAARLMGKSAQALVHVSRRARPQRIRIAAPQYRVDWQRQRDWLLRIRNVTVVLLIAAYAIVLVTNRVRVAGGADSSGYLNQADLWRKGHLIVPLDLPRQLGVPIDLFNAFIPLGFVPGPRAGTMVPSYPAGLPLHMALFSILGGRQAAFLVVPFAAVATVLLVYVLSRDLKLPQSWAAGAAAVVGLCPVFVFHGIQPMSDVLATFWSVAAITCALRSTRGARWAAIAGLCAGVGVLVRPTNILLLPAVALAVGRRRNAVFALLAGLAPCAIFQMALSNHIYGSPFLSGYGDIRYLLAWTNFPPRITHYTYWLAAQLTPIIFPLGLLAFGVPRIPLRDRVVLFAWFFPFFLFYCFYGPYDEWWYTRFLLPATPPLIIVVFQAGHVLLSDHSRWLRTTVALVVFGIIATTEWAVASHFGVLNFADTEDVYRQSILGSRRLLPQNALVVTMQMSGAWYYYNGTTTVRWDGLNGDDFQVVRAYAGIAERRWFALLSAFEVEDAAMHTEPAWRPEARFRDVTLFSLTTDASADSAAADAARSVAQRFRASHP
jgi:hypothetical protein